MPNSTDIYNMNIADENGNGRCFPSRDATLKFNNGDEIYIKISRKNIPNGIYATEDHRGVKFSEETLKENKENSEKAILYMTQLKYFHKGFEKKVKICIPEFQRID